MLIVKPKHGRRQYKGGRGIITSILNSPLAQKLAIAAVTGAARGLTQSALKRRQEQEGKWYHGNEQIKSSTVEESYSSNGFFNS